MSGDQPDADEVVEQVHDLYKDFPYPNHRVVSSVVARLLEATVAEQHEPARGPIRYLDAGCGTAEQTLGVKRSYPQLNTTGIDYSEASLRVARELSAKHRLDATFEHRNLMEPLEGLGPFELITSVGVLHSLPDPATGLRHLREVIAPGGVFMGMVYGTMGKWEMFQARDALQLLCGDDVDRGEQLQVLRDGGFAVNAGPLHYVDVLKTRMRFGPDIDPLEAARRVMRGRSDNYQADSYTHVQEETYTWDELIALLEDTGWQFEGWPKRSGMPDDPAQLFSGRALELARTKTPRQLAAIYERIVKPGNLFFLATPAD